MPEIPMRYYTKNGQLKTKNLPISANHKDIIKVNVIIS